jgi:hypothetical protein
MLLSFPAANGEDHMSIVSQLFQIQIGGNQIGDIKLAVISTYSICAQACDTQAAWQMALRVVGLDARSFDVVCLGKGHWGGEDLRPL